jgi:hypothetical protein
LIFDGFHNIIISDLVQRSKCHGGNKVTNTKPQLSPPMNKGPIHYF